MVEWPLRTIGDFVANGEVSLQTGPFGAQLHAHDYLPTGIAVVPTEGIRAKKIDHTVLPKISAAKALALARHRLIEDDILFARRGVQATGRTAIVTAQESGFICGTGAIRLRVIRDDGELDARFLAHLLSAEASIAWFKFHAIGATMPNLNEGIIRSFPFQVPPKPEQRAMAELLSALDDKIELNRRMNETLEASARALFRDWFVDFGPTRAKAEGHFAYLATDVWSLFPDRLNDDGVPDGWRTGMLADIIDVSSAEPLKRGVAAPYLDMAALPTSGSNAQPAVQREYASGTRFRNGDTLLARITPCLENGKTAFVQALPENTVGWGSTEFIVLRAIWPVPEAVPYLIARDDDFRRHAIQSMTGTSGRQRASADTVAKYPMALPPDDRLWRCLLPALDSTFERIARNAQVSQALAKTRDGLLPKLMSGEIRVRDAEALAA